MDVATYLASPHWPQSCIIIRQLVKWIPAPILATRDIGNILQTVTRRSHPSRCHQQSTCTWQTTHSPANHKAYKLSHDCVFLALFRNSLLRMLRAKLWCFFLSFFLLSLTTGGITVLMFSLRRIWLRLPTSSSSTWWFKAADVSAYLQSKLSAHSRASGRCRL